MNENSTGTVAFQLDSHNPPQLTDDERERLRGLRDEEIDFSDAPRLSAGAKPMKLNAVVLDSDVLEFFQGCGFRPDAARVNAALREYMATHPKAS